MRESRASLYCVKSLFTGLKSKCEMSGYISAKSFYVLSLSCSVVKGSAPKVEYSVSADPKCCL